jgi:hypothetical protein
MASTAPAQPNPAQSQNGNRSPHVNGGQGDQQFKQNGRNPAHKKNYNKYQERPRRRDREDNETNGSSVGRSEEYRERERRKGRGSREAQNANGNANANGNHAKAEASEEPKEASKAPDHIDGSVEQVLVDELQEKFPQVPVDSIHKCQALHSNKCLLNIIPTLLLDTLIK